MKTATGKGLLILVTFSLIVSIFASVGTIGDVQASGPTYSSHGPISITSHGDLLTLKSSGTITGSGTVTDPFVINGYDITGTGGACINVYNITDYLVISNCYLHGNSYGVEISRSSHITVTNSNCSDNVRYGIWLDYSGNNTLTNNVCIVGAHGIYTVASSDNIMENNTCRATAACAVMLAGASSRNIFSNNTCYSSGDNGLYVLNYSDYNIISNNVFKNNRGHGIHLANAHHNEVYGNDIIDNNGSSSVYNALHPQAADTGIGNHWNTGSYGNYWSDWTTPDVNGDGIVDNPYPIGEGSSLDNYPLVNIHNSITVPGAPTGLTATAGNGQASLIWNAPGNGGAAIDYYIVYRGGTDVNHSTTTSFTDMGLTDGVTYSYAIAAHNIAGLGAQSSLAIVTPLAVPDAPTSLTATPTDGQVSLSWTVPASDGGAAIEYYLVYVDGTAGPDHYTTTSATITGLTNGQSYSFTVAAHNSAGNGSQSGPATAIPFTIPGTPGVPTAVPGSTQVSLSWTAPASDGGAAIEYYLVYVDGTAGPDHYTTTSVTITGLTNGQSYSFTVAAHNSAGNGSQTSGVSATPATASTVPGTPTGLTATTGNSQVSLSWTAPASDGGAAIDYYIIYQDGVDVQHPTGAIYMITGLTNGQVYSYTVAAHNSVGTGLQSSAVTATPSTAPAAPGVPTGLSIIPGNAEVSISWAAPTSNGGASIDYYIVFQDGFDVAHSATSSITVTGLTNGQSYAFTVAAHNSIGVGPQTSGVSAIPLQTPGVPTGLTVTSGNSQVSISWSAPTSDGGAVIDYYVVYVNGIVRSEHYTTTSTTVNGLTNGQSYTFTVAAHNSAGTGAQTSAVTATPDVDVAVPGVPTNLITMAGTGTVKLSWTAPSGGAVDYYIVYQNGVDVAHPTTNFTTIQGLTSGENYSFAVAAHNSGGVGGQTPVHNISPIAAGSASGDDNTALVSVVLALLLAAIVAAVLIVRRKRKA
ncbi:MAG TPA: fibronectin type III domain-containing protein [Methanomassiliicoccales archaeon]